MRAIDTNVLVRLITRDDARQAAAAEGFVETGAWVSVVVLADAMWRLARFYKLSPEDLAKAIDMLLHHRDLVIQDAEAVASALELFRAKPALGFSDCLILQLARKTGHLPMGTFDRGLSKVEGTQRIQPAPPTSPPSTPPAHSPRRQS